MNSRYVLGKGFEWVNNAWYTMRHGCNRFIIETTLPFKKSEMEYVVRNSKIFDNGEMVGEWSLESAPRMGNLIVLFFANTNKNLRRVVVCKLQRKMI